MSSPIRPVYAVLAALTACAGGSTFTPGEGVATDIRVVAYSDGWGAELGSETLATEGDLTCGWPEEEPYNDPPSYYLYASADGYFTELYLCAKDETVAIDLDAVGEHDDAIAGAIFATQSFFVPTEVSDTKVGFSPGGAQLTDDQARYALADVPLGDVELSLRWEGERFTHTVSNGAGVDYSDWLFPAPMQAAKPNIYLWPQQTTDVSVTLGFPRGGHIDVSDPLYGDGWRVTATTDGMLDALGEPHEFLFYEATVPPVIQLDRGWVIDGAQPEAELRDRLAHVGFVGREIDDFVDYWVPRLSPAPYYAVYPQRADDWVSIEIDPAPDTLLRELWLIHPMPAWRPLTEPEVQPIDRSGFTVTEWGVILP